MTVTAQEGSSTDMDVLRRTLMDMVDAAKPLPSERSLVEELGVPRSRLRRVLADLRSTGVLPAANMGRRAANPHLPQVDGLARVATTTDVIELRMILEPQFARLAAIRASALEIGRIVRFSQSPPDGSYGAADLAFHREVARSARNPLAHELYDLLRHVGSDSRVRMPQFRPPCPKRRIARDAEHAEIARAIADRDPDRAESAMRIHLSAVQHLIHARLMPGKNG